MFKSRLITLFVFLQIITLSFSQSMGSTHLYRGRFTNSSDILYTWDGEHLYRGRFTNSSDILYTWDGLIKTTDGPIPIPLLIICQ